MRRLLLCFAIVFANTCFVGCQEPETKDKVRVKAPFVDVRVGEDGSTRVKAPGTDVKVEDD